MRSARSARCAASALRAVRHGGGVAFVAASADLAAQLGASGADRPTARSRLERGRLAARLCWEPAACSELEATGTSRSSATRKAGRTALKRSDLINKNERDFDDMYERGDIIGFGAFGFVLKCTNKMTGDEQAVKFISHGNLAEKDLFEKELQALVRLDHPHIMRLVEYFEQESQFILVCQMCFGGDLADFMISNFQKCPDGLPENMCSNMIRQMLKSLFGCHSADVIHKDVKPSNFVFATREVGSPLILIDLGLGEFGVHSHVDGASQDDEQTGTIPFMAPEVIFGRGYDDRCDVWSAGCILFHALTGEAFLGVDTVEQAQKALSSCEDYCSKRLKQVKAEQRISAEAIDLLRGMLEYDRTKRLSASDALQHPFVLKGYQQADYAPVLQNAKEIVHKAIGRMRHFANMPQMWCLAHRVIAHFVPQVQINEMRDLYRVLDESGEGDLTKEELKLGLAKLDIEVPEDLDDLMPSGQHFNYEEFLARTLPPGIYLKPEYALIAWRSIAAGRQRVGFSELRDQFTNDSEDEIRAMIFEATGDTHGTIDFPLFEKMLKQHDEFVRQLEVFKTLCADQLKDLVDRMEVMSFRKGDAVVNCGDEAKHLFILKDGQCSVWRGGIKLCIFQGGDYFGEAGLVDNKPRTATIVVESDTAEVIQIDRVEFQRILPELQNFKVHGPRKRAAE